MKNGIEYTVFDMKVTWFEAEVLCESQDQGSLANVDFEKTSIFLSEALSETNMELESLWVGARRQSNFTWINSGNILADKFLATRGKSFKNIERNCLSFQRKYHDRPNFIDLECRLKRPFICEKGMFRTCTLVTKLEMRFSSLYESSRWFVDNSRMD